MSAEQRALGATLKEIDAAIQGISEEIDAALVPKVRATANELRTIQGSYGAFVRVEQLRAQIDSLKDQLLDLDVQPDQGEKLEFINARFAASGYRLPDLLRTITLSNAFSRIIEAPGPAKTASADAAGTSAE